MVIRIYFEELLNLTAEAMDGNNVDLHMDIQLSRDQLKSLIYEAELTLQHPDRPYNE